MLTLFRGYLRPVQGPALLFHGGLVPQVSPMKTIFCEFQNTLLA
jgi:hypothetical protein